MKYILLSIFGVLLYVFSVFFSEIDKNGIEVYPIYYSLLIEVLTLIFSILASFNLWESNKKLVILFLLFSIINLIAVFSLELFNPSVLTPTIIIFINFAKLISLIIYFWVIIVLWKKA